VQLEWPPRPAAGRGGGAAAEGKHAGRPSMKNGARLGSRSAARASPALFFF
jgi:hypothetical protein